MWKHVSAKSEEVVYMPGEIATLLNLFVSTMKYIVGVYKTVKKIHKLTAFL
jgi:hypothetical protein